MHATLAAAPAASLVPELELRRREYEAAADQARRLVEGLSDAQLNWRPAPGAWSIAECLDHLRVTADEILAELDPAMERARARGRTGSPPFRYGWVGSWFVRAVGPRTERSRKMPSPRIYRPVSEHAGDRVLPAFVELQERLVERLGRANGLDLGIKVRSPVSPLLRIALGQWFEAIAGHQVRHLQQAGAVREHPAFPRS